MKCKLNSGGWCYSKSDDANSKAGACMGYARCPVRDGGVNFMSNDGDMFDVLEPTLGADKPTLGADERKQRPVYSGLLKYFPDACMAVANCSFVANEQHNPGEPMHWNRAKSADEHDALVRHLMEAGAIDSDGIRHSTKVVWRALAALQKEIEQAQEEV